MMSPAPWVRPCPRSRATILLAACIASGSFGASAQNPTNSSKDAELRRKALGEVRNVDGEAWTGARVILIATPHKTHLSDRDVDRVETTTDERGRFRVPVLRHHRYTCWATSPADAAPAKTRALRMSEIAEGVRAGDPVLLKESKRRTVGRAATLTGLDAWKDQGPFRARAVLQTQNACIVPLALTPEGRVEIPAMPGPKVEVQVLDRRGVILLRHTNSLASAAREPHEWRIPPPKIEFVEVRDVNDGKGVADAEVLLDVQAKLVSLGKTAKDGVAEIRLPKDTRGTILVRAASYAAAPTQSGPSTQLKDKTWKPLRAGTNPQRHANLDHGFSFKGRILLAPDVPARDLTILVNGQAMHYHKKSSRYLNRFTDVVRTDAEGHFSISGCIQESSYRTSATLLLRSEHLLKLPEQWRKSVHFAIDNALKLDDGKPGKTTDLGDVVLSRYRPLQIEVKQPTGAHAPGARVVIGELSNSFGASNKKSGQHHADRAGRSCVLIRPGAESLLLVSHDSGFYARSISLREGTAQKAIPCLIKLEKAFTISGRVIGKKGKPVGGMTLSRRLQWGRGGGIQPIEEAPEEDAPAEVVLRPLTGHQLHRALQQYQVFSQKCVTDKQGRFEFQVAPAALKYTITGTKTTLGVFKQRVREVLVVEGPMKDVRLEVQ